MRKTLVDNDSDDSELLAQRLREARNSPRKRYIRGELRKLAALAIASRRRRKRDLWSRFNTSVTQMVQNIGNKSVTDVLNHECYLCID